MRIRTSIIAAGTAAVLGTTGALVAPAVASAHSASTTLKFTCAWYGVTGRSAARP